MARLIRISAEEGVVVTTFSTIRVHSGEGDEDRIVRLNADVRTALRW